MVARVPPGETSVAAAGESRRWPEDAAAGAEERSRLPR
jgi:hypothetical protein